MSIIAPILRSLLAGLAALIVAVTALALIDSNEWWVRVWDFPRLQIAGLGLIVLAGMAAMRVWRWGWPKESAPLLAGSLAIAIVYQAVRIAPYLPPWPHDVRAASASCPADRSLSILVANVLQDNRDYDRALAEIMAADADIVLLLETDAAWAAALAPLARSHPHRIAEPLPNTYGMMLFSRRSLGSAVLRHRVQADIPSIRANIPIGDGESFRFFAIHPRPPVPGQDTNARDAELVLTGREVRAYGQSAIVAGDLNDVAWSDTTQLFQEVSGLGDPRIGRWLHPTFNAQWPLLKWPLDHVFVSRDFTLIEMRTLAGIGSDHYPVFVRLCHDPRAPEAGPPPSAAARQEAREAVAEGNWD